MIVARVPPQVPFYIFSRESNYFVCFKIYGVQIVCQNSFEDVDIRDQLLLTTSESAGARRE